MDINGHTVTIIFDTGATPNYISSKCARRLKLDTLRTEEREISDFDSSVSISEHTVETLIEIPQRQKINFETSFIEVKSTEELIAIGSE